MGVGVQCLATAALPPPNDPVPTVQEAGWDTEPVWMGVENLAATTRIRSADCPAHENPIS
jgi:hypothetical protein